MTDQLFKTRNRSFSQSSIRKRILKSSSEHGSGSQKQLIRSSTMASFMPKLERLVQQGKIEQFLNSDKHSKAKLMYSTHVNDMEKQLTESKKSLSSMNLKARSRELAINKLKNEIFRLNKQKQALRVNNDAISKLYDTTVSSLDFKKVAKQNTEWIQKSYLHIKERLLKDEYFQKIEYQRKQKRFQSQRQRSQYLEKKSMEISQIKKQLDKAVSQAKNITSEQTHLKNQLIDVINQDLQEKEFLNIMRIQKQKKQSEINRLSTWVIEKEELNKYLNILYTHRILSQIIRVKNSNLLKRYSQVQSAYLHIKSNTNVVEFQKILKKMEEQDSIYDITVKKVSDLEYQLQKMEVTIQKAKREKQNILSQEGNVQNLYKGYYQGIQKDQYQILLSKNEKAEHRIVQDEILKQRIIEWGKKLAERIKTVIPEGSSIEETLEFCVGKLNERKKKN